MTVLACTGQVPKGNPVPDTRIALCLMVQGFGISPAPKYRRYE